MSRPSFLQDQKGVVALATTIIVSLLLLIITTAMVSLMMGELRQAEDADQSIRAYYAAEAGAEEALLELKRAINSGGALSFSGNCVASSVADIAYTCKRITATSNTLENKSARDRSQQFEIPASAGFNRIDLSWNISGFEQDPLAPNPFPFISNFPPGASWNFPAVMELSDVTYPSGTFTAGNINLQTLVLRPNRTGGAATGIGAVGPVSVRCTANVPQNDPYNCRISITGFNAGQNHILRLRPRYAGAHYKLEFYNNGTRVSVPDQNAAVDVTARAGDVFRRIRINVPIRSGAASGLDHVLFSDTDICKNFEVRDGNNSAVGMCP
ncbi:hypothetical protein KY386_01870 [Candidatus Parcubacteria bacterium]|nr:hypothetical protein [Candidatus Parcubacteria bacterium]